MQLDVDGRSKASVRHVYLPIKCNWKGHDSLLFATKYNIYILENTLDETVLTSIIVHSSKLCDEAVHETCFDRFYSAE